MKTIVEKLRSQKMKITPQRLAIYETLAHTTTHPSAETIYRALEASSPSISIATVYKTLCTLVNAGLIQQLNVGEGHYRYDANERPHPHIICKQCNRVFDLPHTATIDRLRNEYAEKTAFTIDSEQLYFYGICQDCKTTEHFQQC